MNVGFIGLGIMGTPMALHLLEAGHQLFVHTRSRVPDAITATSAKACASAAEVAKQSEVIVTMVPDTPDVERVLFGPSGVAESLPSNGLTRSNTAGSAPHMIVSDAALAPTSPPETGAST